MRTRGRLVDVVLEHSDRVGPTWVVTWDKSYPTRVLANAAVAALTMNSLALLSRQLDVLVFPRTPPSTPVDTQPPLLPHRPSLRRRGSDTGRRSSPHSSRPARPRRSYSSPSGFLPIPFQKPPVSDTSTRLQPTLRFRSTLRRLFFVRVFVIVWKAICATWVSWLPGEIDGNRNQPGDQSLRDANNDDPRTVPPTTQESPFPPLTRSPPLDAPSDLVCEIHPRLEMSTLPTPPPSPLPLLGSTSLSIPVHDPHPTPPAEPPREDTPPMQAHKTPFHLPKTLVLDLDETLIHSTSKPMSLSSGGFGLLGFGRRNKGHTVEVVLSGRSTLYHVYKRPFVDYFLRKVCFVVPGFLSRNADLS